MSPHPRETSQLPTFQWGEYDIEPKLSACWVFP